MLFLINHTIMDIQTVQRNNELLERLFSKVSSMESGMESLKKTIQEKINPSKKEFLNDTEIEEMFGLTKAVRYKLFSEGRLRKYKTTGKASASLYRYDEVVAAIEAGLIFPKK